MAGLHTGAPVRSGVQRENGPQFSRISGPKSRVKSEIPTHVSGVEFAGFVGKTPAWVSKQVKAGLPHAGGGTTGKPLRIPLAAAFDWIIARAAAEAAAAPVSTTERLRGLQADRLALANAKLRSELCEVADTREVLREAQREIALENERIADALAVRLTGLSPAEIRVAILDELRAADERFSNAIGAFGAANDTNAVREEPDHG